MQLLRFKFGAVYTVNVSAFFGAEAPSHQGVSLLAFFKIFNLRSSSETITGGVCTIDVSAFFDAEAL